MSALPMISMAMPVARECFHRSFMLSAAVAEVSLASLKALWITADWTTLRMTLAPRKATAWDVMFPWKPK